ncbi:NRDE family protein [Pseudolysobacter antarcticus]|uniref:NRDE family protein n=1 Tax=Pseudolysobacter antarcticus TaxID=2511995 RepID=A0A411HEQ0_9GAMM|nr:NRDE family protein [Pseudolysobacter antarcticus]QBB68965.1 NRDE family protein [Pseudolysobacter antarcticus]
MCLIALALDVHPLYRLILAGNRDEFHARPTTSLSRWNDAPDVLAGRDLEASGTWMGVSARGRACVVTNVREPLRPGDFASRGLLASDYLRAAQSAEESAHALLAKAPGYRPFNLLLFDKHDAYFVSNRPQPNTQVLTAGIHGLSNATLDTPWPKIRRLKQALQDWIAKPQADFEHEDFADLFAVLADETLAADADLPNTGVGIEIERRLSPAFIRGPHYGTRACSVIAITHGGEAVFIERRFAAEAAFEGQTIFRFNYGIE